MGSSRRGAAIVIACVVLTAFQMGILCCVTPLYTWGLNAIPNDVMQHAQTLQNTFVQVATAIGITSFSVLMATGPILDPVVPPIDQTMLGIHVAFLVVGALMLVAFVLMLALVKNKPLEKEGLVSELV